MLFSKPMLFAGGRIAQIRMESQFFPEVVLNKPSVTICHFTGKPSRIQSFLNSLDGMSAGIDALIPEAIADHVPILYATHIWNNIPQERPGKIIRRGQEWFRPNA
jgi:hypothetical protein